MALVVADRVKESTNTSGTGALSLTGAQTGFQSFSAGVGGGNTTYYAVSSALGSEFEVGIGTYDGGSDTLSRDTVLASSNGGSLVNFPAGTKDVYVVYPADKAVYADASGVVNASGGFSGPLNYNDVTNPPSETVTALSLDNTTNTLSYTDEQSVTTDIDLSLYIDDTNLARLTGGTLDGSTGIATFTRDDGTDFTVDFSPLFDNTNLNRITLGSFNTSNGVLTLTRDDNSEVTTDLDGRYLAQDDAPGAVVATYTSTDTSTDFNASNVPVPWDTTLLSDSGVSQPSSTEIQVADAGLWEFSVNLSFYSDSSSIRENPGVRFWINGVAKDVTAQSSYTRNASSHNNSSSSMTAVFNLSANDKVEVKTIIRGSNGTVNLVANESLLVVKKLAGRVLTQSDADTLGGQNGTYYLNYGNFTNTPSIPSNASDVGALPSSGKAADSDLLDGQNGSYYLNYNNFTNTPSGGGVQIGQVVWSLDVGSPAYGGKYLRLDGGLVNKTDWPDLELFAQNTLYNNYSGLYFTESSDSQSIVSDNINGVAGNNTVFVAVGDAATLLYSTDGGVSWIKSSDHGADTSKYYKDAASNGTNFVAVGSGGLIAYSTDDGVSWAMSSDSETLTTDDLYSVTAHGTNFVAVGNNGVLIYSTDDGVSWTKPSDSGSVTTRLLRGVASDGGNLVAAGDYYNSLIYSTDGGVNWAVASTTVNEVYYCVKTNGTNFVAGGNNGVLIYSTDGGVNWEVSPYSESDIIKQQRIFDIASVNGHFIVPGKIASFDGGVNWIKLLDEIVSYKACAADSQNNIVSVGTYGIIHYSLLDNAKLKLLNLGDNIHFGYIKAEE